MGQFLSKKSREDYYEQVLTRLQTEIQQRQQSLNHFRLTLRSVQVHLALVSVIAYGCAMAYCFLQYRLEREGNVVRTAGLIIFPFGVYYLRKGLNWIGGRFIDLRQRQLKDLQQELKLRLEDLKKETSYYKTRSILERYDESERPKKDEASKPPSKAQSQQETPKQSLVPVSNRPIAPVGARPLMLTHPLSQPSHPRLQPQFKSPTWMDRFMDALIGDDSRNQKYALICQHCFNHNGLAEAEAFVQGIRYRCPNCGFMNIKAPKPTGRPIPEEESRIKEELEIETKIDSASSSANSSPKRTRKLSSAAMMIHDRLAIEVEFVECLANPAYLNFLVEQGYLKDQKFLAYLEYLQYLIAAPYNAAFTYPNGLIFLRLLSASDFRKQLQEATGPVIDFIHKQQYHHWVYLSRSEAENVRKI